MPIVSIPLIFFSLYCGKVMRWPVSETGRRKGSLGSLLGCFSFYFFVIPWNLPNVKINGLYVLWYFYHRFLCSPRRYHTLLPWIRGFVSWIIGFWFTPSTIICYLTFCFLLLWPIPVTMALTLSNINWICILSLCLLQWHWKYEQIGGHLVSPFRRTTNDSPTETLFLLWLNNSCGGT